MTNEKYARPCFYGAMIAEGIVAMIWAAAAMAYFGGPEGLNSSGMTPAVIVDKICNSWLGQLGGIIAILGVVICPITSGDTAFRSLRLTLADALKFNQKSIRNRLFVAIPIFIVAFFLNSFDFSTLWKYVGISNQTLASITLWAGAAYLVKMKKCHWILSLPAMFLTSVCVAYFIVSPHSSGGLNLPYSLAWQTAVGVAIAVMILFIVKTRKR
jgi:carbon starvation protein CstA